MKELLLKTKDGKCIYNNSEMDSVPKHIEAIEIPDWANYAYENDEGVCFLTSELGYNHPLLLWQRDSVDEKKEDNVNNPSHYNKGGVECIYAIESSMTKEAFCGYLKGNVIKYMYRYENKGGVESLKKAQWYLSKLINLESV